MTLPWPDRLLTLADWAALPPDPSRRFELVEGVLVVAPRPAVLHQLAIVRLCAALQEQLTDELVAVGEVEVVVAAGATAGPATVRVFLALSCWFLALSCWFLALSCCSPGVLLPAVHKSDALLDDAGRYVRL